jgi:hypothetical protein
MERLHRCPDLTQRVERELRTISTSVVNQSQSREILTRIAHSLGASPSVVNLFALPESLTLPEYLMFVRERVAEFQPLDLQKTLAEAEAEAFDSSPPRSFGDLASQLSQWQRDNGASSGAPKASDHAAEASDSSEAGDDASTHQSDTDDAPDGSENDTDDAADESNAEPADRGADPLPEDALQLCERLLQDPVQLSNLTREVYDTVNIHGDNRVNLSQLQPFLDYLVTHNFDPSRLRSIVNELANREFAHIRELSYVKFCVFVRSVLQRYTA